MSHKEADSVIINTVTLDSFVHNRGISKIDFVKVDVEGYELEVLYGSREVLSTLKPNLAIAWYHARDDHDAIIQVIKQANIRYCFLAKDHILWAY